MTNIDVSWEIVGIGVDYLTVTAKEVGKRSELQSQAELMSSIAERNGGQRKPWKSQGYDGWKCGAVTYGWREDSAILKLSGDVPAHVLMLMSKTGYHCTRIDVQVTARSNRHWPLYGESAMLQAEWDRECAVGTPENRNWQKIKRIDGRGEGDTIKVGSRSSMRYGRLYDKGAQSGEERYWNCWRWEYEYKKEMAPIVLQRIANAGASVDVIGGIVAGQYMEQCFKLPWELDKRLCLDGPQRVESDAERKLQWLRRQVKPTLDWLLEQGHIDSVEDWWYSLSSSKE